jgi:hypothetical protein
LRQRTSFPSVMVSASFGISMYTGIRKKSVNRV